MTKSSLCINLSMSGPNPTGLGVYSSRCAENLARFFNLTLISSNEVTGLNARVIQSPANVAIGGGRFSGLSRIFYSLFSPPQTAEFIYCPTHAGFFGIANQVITIHDFICFRHPVQKFLQSVYFKFVLPNLAKRCRAVFTVSEVTKQDIIHLYGLNPDRVFVVPNGVDRKRFHTPRNIESSHEPYLLAVGASYPHKNIRELFERSQFWCNDYRLKIVGASSKYGKWLALQATKFGLSNRVDFLNYVSDEHLVELYQNCQALVFPSLWEGFGIPPLEAMSCGRPAIISDIPVHREIFEDAALYVTPGDVSTWRRAFELLADPDVRLEKQILGIEKAQQYSWESSGKKLVSALLAVEPTLAEALKMECDLTELGFSAEVNR